MGYVSVSVKINMPPRLTSHPPFYLSSAPYALPSFFLSLFFHLLINVYFLSPGLSGCSKDLSNDLDASRSIVMERNRPMAGEALRIAITWNQY